MMYAQNNGLLIYHVLIHVYLTVALADVGIDVFTTSNITTRRMSTKIIDPFALIK